MPQSQSEPENASSTRETVAADARERSWWKWSLPYLGGLVAFIALIGSLITFSVSKGIEIYRQITWEERVMVISYRSEGPQVFLNAGDGQVFLSHVEIKSEADAKVRPVNFIIKPNEFNLLPVQPNPDIDKGSVVTDKTDDEWKQLLDKYIEHEKHSLHPSLFTVYYSLDSPVLQIYKQVLGSRLRTIPAKAKMVYFSANGGKRFEQMMDFEGVLISKKTEANNSQ